MPPAQLRALRTASSAGREFHASPTISLPLTFPAITGDTALRLAHLFGTSAQFWLDLQSLYDIRLAEQKTGRTIKALPTLKRPKRGAVPLGEQQGSP